MDSGSAEGRLLTSSSAAAPPRPLPLATEAATITTDDEMKAGAEDARARSGTPQQQTSPKPNQVGSVMLHGIPIVSLVIDTRERLCLAQISNTLLRDFSYNEIHNRRVALGITCVQCTPVQLEILRRAGAMPVSSRRCGMITRREAERLCRSFLGDNSPPRLPDHFAFDVTHSCAWGCRGAFLPSRYNSSRAKCIRCSFCRSFFSPNKFIFHSHRLPDSEYVQPDAANFNSWRRHLSLAGSPSEEVIHAWEDVKAMFNGGTRKRMLAAAASGVSSSRDGPHGSRRSEQRHSKASHHVSSSPQDVSRHQPPPQPTEAQLQGYLRTDKPRAEFPICRPQNAAPPTGAELSPFVHLSPIPPPTPFPDTALHPPPPPTLHYDLHRSFVDYVWSRQHCGQGGRGKPEPGFAPFSPYSLPWFKRPIIPFPPQPTDAPHSPIVLPPPPPGALAPDRLGSSTTTAALDSRPASPPTPALPHQHPPPLGAPFHPRASAPPTAVISNLYASAFRPVGGASRRGVPLEERPEAEKEAEREEDEEEETVDIETTEDDDEGWRLEAAAKREAKEAAEADDEEGARSGEDSSDVQKSKKCKATERCRLSVDNSTEKSPSPTPHIRSPPALHRHWMTREPMEPQSERIMQGKAALTSSPHSLDHERVYCHEMARQLNMIRELGVGTTVPSDHCSSPYYSEPLLTPASTIPMVEPNRRVVRLVSVHDRLKDFFRFALDDHESAFRLRYNYELCVRTSVLMDLTPYKSRQTFIQPSMAMMMAQVDEY